MNGLEESQMDLDLVINKVVAYAQNGNIFALLL